MPEITINEITGENNQHFVNQQVDFYLPQAKMVIEIDGQQHKTQFSQRVSDKERDEYLAKFDIVTFRITTKELQNGEYHNIVDRIKQRLSQHQHLLNFYQKSSEKIDNNNISEEEKETKLLPTAIIRFQILLIDLLLRKRISFEEDWNFNVRINEELEDFVKLAVNDLWIWFKNLYRLYFKKEFEQPKLHVQYSTKEKFKFSSKSINIDFSLFKRYTDENEIEPQIIFVRTDYFDIVKDKNYFRVSTYESLNYHITDEDKPVLRFFLQNLFDKNNFREGQFPIIANALNLHDTIGLLPTGGGKSLCYQLPCLLQPCINFVVCPIKSLMYDQADNLKRQDVLVTNINFICGDQDAVEKEKILSEYSQGKYLFVWISPERFQIPNFRSSISKIVNDFSIAYAVVDEVHCLSEWGHDFRTSYLNLAKTIDKLSPKDEYGEGKIKFIGLTATASVNVLKDIKIEFSRQKQKLEDENIKSLLDYSRKELVFEVINDNRNKEQVLKDLLKKEDFINTSDKSGIVFTPNVNGKVGCYELANKLNTIYPDKVSWYSGSCPNDKKNQWDEKKFNEEKSKVQKAFKDNKYQLLCATKAFGMGIDKQNIYYTFHYGLPSSIEALCQEAGRAGRWDKSKKENKQKKGHCYILHSHEMQQYQTQVDLLFDVNTTFSDINNIQSQVQRNGQDIFRQIFLFLQNQRDVKDDFDLIQLVIKNFYEPNCKRDIAYQEISKIGMSPDAFEKVIYRLSLLGVVEDWTRDFVNVFTIEFNDLDENRILKSISNYINKYDADTKVENEIESISISYANNTFEKAVCYLLEWIFKHIIYSRKQSLKTISEWCCEFKDSDDFKRRIDEYFTFNDTTFVLQYIAENPNDIGKWFEVFVSNNKVITKEEFKRLQDSTSRFLESYNNNNGLNFISGIIRLYFDNYEDTDGRLRFENMLNRIKDSEIEFQNNFFELLLPFAKNLFVEDQLYSLCFSLLKYFPKKLDELVEYYNLPLLYNEVIKGKTSELRILNKKLYEQFSRF